MYFQTNQKNECYGCQACVNICPTHCIEMREDERGFRYPVIDHSRCTPCNLCEKVCPHSYHSFIDKSAVKAYIGIHDSEDIVYKSSSGGAFSAIFEVLLQEGYTVFGARFTDSLEVIHDSAVSEQECEAFRKSKYIQSDLNHCYKRIRELLTNGRKVLFSGTSCQCAALYSFLAESNISTEGLCTVGILCHGVPSQYMFNIYKTELNRKSRNGPLVRFTFRYKSRDDENVNSRSAELEFASGFKKIVTVNDDPFLRSYYQRLGYRPACATCEFARQDRVSDITLGDAWKIERLFPQYNPLSGVSLILSATEKGHAVISKLKGMNLTEISAEWALNSQRVMNHPTMIHKKTELYYRLLPKLGFRTAVFRVTDPPFVRKILSKAKSVVKRIFGLSSK